MSRRRIVIATTNPGKVREIAEIYRDIPVIWVSASEFGAPPLVEESGATFRENASLKAQAICRWSGLPTLAEDSGLEVDALGGAPGVHSARFAGESATDAQNVALLLERLSGVPAEKRTARFRAAVALWWGDADPEGLFDEADGTCEGAIAFAPAGASGFGYDPVFVPRGENATFAELGPAAKNSLSHRFRALARLRPRLVERLLRSA